MTKKEDSREIGYKIFDDMYTRVKREIPEEELMSTMLTISASILSAVLDAVNVPPEQAITIPQRAIEQVLAAGASARNAAEIEIEREKVRAH